MMAPRRAGAEIVITGTQQAVDSAKEIIAEFLNNTCRVVMKFKPDMSEFIVGRGGKTVKRIQEETGTLCCGPSRDALGGGGGNAPPPPPPGRPAYAQPLSPRRQVPASTAFVTDSNRPQPLWQPPPTACLTASLLGPPLRPLPFLCIPGAEAGGLGDGAGGVLLPGGLDVGCLDASVWANQVRTEPTGD